MAHISVFGPNPFVSITIESMMSDAEGEEIHFHAAGQGVWVARAASGLGAEVSLVTTQGGEHGALLGALLSGETFDVRFVAVAGEGASYVDDRRGGDRARLAEHRAEALSRHEVDDLYGAALAAGITADVAVLCGTGEHDMLPPDFYSRLAHDLRATDTPVVADLSGRFAAAALTGGLDVLKMAEDEARAIGGDDDSGAETDDLSALANHLVRSGARRVVITRGGEPALAADETAVRELRVPQLAAADHRGAGDSMTAALAVGLASGDPWEDVLARAAAAGAANVTRHGLGTSSAEEVRAIEVMASTSQRSDGGRPTG